VSRAETGVYNGYPVRFIGPAKAASADRPPIDLA